MEEVISGCESGEPGKEVLFLNSQIITNIRLVLKGFEFTKKKEKKDEKTGALSGGGGSGRGSYRLIAPIHELKLIREVQFELNRQTEEHLKKKEHPEKDPVKTRLIKKQQKLYDLLNGLLQGIKR
jgi:hypothetical protein